MHKSISIILLLVLCLSAGAYDFKKSVKGSTFYFKVLQDNSVEVVYPGASPYAPYEDFPKPSGRLTIPEKVVYDGESYTVTSIGAHAFEGCDGLTAVTLPKPVTRIGAAAFRDCSGLRSVTVESERLVSVDLAFGGCTALDTLTIDSEVRQIASFAFCDMESLKVVHFNAKEASGMRNIFYGSMAPVRLVVGPEVRQIPAELCYNFSGLRSVEGGEGLSSIGKEAFYYCVRLDSVSFPPSLQEVGASAFSYCKLNRITIRCPQVPQMAGNPFSGIDKRTYVVIPCGSLEQWLASPVGRYFDRLFYPSDCGATNTLTPATATASPQSDTVYIHDTIFIHDTVYLSTQSETINPTEFTEHTEPTDPNNPTDHPEQLSAQDSLAYTVEGRILTIHHISRYADREYVLYDEDGRVLARGIFPEGTDSNNFSLRLPRRKRCFLQVEGFPPVSLKSER